MYKLFERKGRCLKALKQFPRALEAMKSAEMWMKYSTLSEAKSSSFKKEISKQVRRINTARKVTKPHKRSVKA